MEYTYNIQEFNIKNFFRELGTLDLGIYAVKHKDGVLTVHVTEELTDLTELNNIVTNHDSNESILDIVKQAYIKKEEDGKYFYNTFRSRLYLAYTQQIYTLQEALGIEIHLENVANDLNKGNWLTAKSNLEAKSLIGAFDQTLKDEILLGITQYITDNY